LIELAKTPGWKSWVWDYAKKLDAESSGYFKGIADDLQSAMTGPDEVSGCAAPESMRHP
jgi:hypothetical protein